MDRLPPLDAAAVHALLARMTVEAPAEAVRIDFEEQHSNSLARVHLPSGRVLVVKRARYAALSRRFETSAEASRLLHQHTDLLAPRYLEVEELPGEPPLLAYWWIPEPTLAEVWVGLDSGSRTGVLGECGRLLRRIHTVRLRAHGPIPGNARAERSLGSFLAEDLLARLGPAVEGCWGEQEPNLRRLHEAFRGYLEERGEPEPVLVHNDFFSENVLCSLAEGGVHCVGVLDFEDSFAGPVEADLARTELLHGPLFGRDLGAGWFEHVLEGYGQDPDPALVSLFRAYHLMNMGFHAAATGFAHHAAEVGRAVERELDCWREGRRHREILA